MIHAKDKRIVVAPDSFKGCLTAVEVCDAVAHGLEGTDISLTPMADGGEGTLDAIAGATGARRVEAMGVDPLGRPGRFGYLLLPSGAAVIELAVASGLTLLAADERNPLEASTYGTGLLMADALRRGCSELMVCIGGSATNDAAMGLLHALGFRFTDDGGAELKPSGKNLVKIHDVDCSGVMPELSAAKITVACDVDNPFCGARGAVAVYAAQKGADVMARTRLEAGMCNVRRVVERFRSVDVQTIRGGGAAGGVGGMLVAMAGAALMSGAAMVADAVGLERILAGADVVITGEGSMDRQTLSGKVPMEVLTRARRAQVAALGIAGQVTDRDALLHAGFADVRAVTPDGMPLELAMRPEVAAENIAQCVRAMMS